MDRLKIKLTLILTSSLAAKSKNQYSSELRESYELIFSGFEVLMSTNTTNTQSMSF